MSGPLALAMFFGVLAAVPLALLPLAIGRAIDAAVGGGPPGGTGLLGWTGVLLALGAVQATGVGLGEYFASEVWLLAATRTQRAVLAHAAGVGAALPRGIRAGEVVAVGSSDIYHIGDVFEIMSRAAGALVAFGAAAAALLHSSPLLGVVVLVGVPLATVGIAPLLGPLRRRTEEHREQVSVATSMAADIVSGLRVLRGIGGERRFADRFAETSQRVRRAGVAAGRIDAWLSGIEVLMPGLVTVGVTWLGARLALSGQITVGQLVAYYGISAYLVIPVSVATEAAHKVSEGVVAARRVVTIFGPRPALSSPAHPVPLPAGPLGLTDPASGLSCPPGQLTVLVPAAQSDPAARADARADSLADRLGRYVETSVRAGGVPLERADLAEVRRRILIAHNQDVLFSGPLADEIGGPGAALDTALDTALWVADATDVVAGLPDGTAQRLTEQGRELSGGQRQRLMLARALSADPDVLVLDEPTSAVDAHTEARIARRVARLRRGRTTVVISHSPLWAAVADHLETPAGGVQEEKETS
ncbi:MAG TPA: ABC transporter ATP-binding protein [Pseudonocardia sp.]|jgi:ABC-type multidrug transport system fused ATPase/permease subunit|nr:ABC transporter ATP-binding protein [Pseudonocardia sp.]